MSLRHAILGVLSAEPMTGYDLVRYIDESVGYVWSASQSQVYPELRRMEQAGLIRAAVAQRGQRAEKRVYSLTEAGETELRRWAADLLAYSPDRDPLYLKALFFDLVPFAAAREQLRSHIAHWSRRLQQWQERADLIRARRLPLLRKRLEQRDPAEHEAIVEFKAWVIEGKVARARMEIEWARRGLALIDSLEARRLAATGTPESHRPVAASDSSPTSRPGGKRVRGVGI